MDWIYTGLIFNEDESIMLLTNRFWLFMFIGLVCLAIGYLLGGINTGILLSNKKFNDDIRNHGSNNAGMTNMLRTYGKRAAAITLLGDILKTVVAIILARVLLGELGAYIAGLGAVIGHVFPCYFGFKGGKGVSTVAAMILCTNLLCFVILFVIFAVIVLGYKYVSLGSVMCMMLYPVILDRCGVHNIFCIASAFIVAILIIVKHKDNIKRLLNGTESKIHLKKSK